MVQDRLVARPVFEIALSMPKNDAFCVADFSCVSAPDLDNVLFIVIRAPVYEACWTLITEAAGRM